MITIATINMWNPSGAGMGVLAILLTAFLLGIVHGITPDEHTWPITFSYAIGSYSWKGGMAAGFLFSVAFTVQRSIMSELSYFALSGFVNDLRFNFWIYLIVGLVMAGSGIYILRRGKIWHLFHTHKMLHAEGGANPQAAPKYMPLVHGFIAGWGTGAFAIITYTALAPNMGSPWIAFLPGTFFGVGTMVMQILLGSLFGQWMAKRKLNEGARIMLARLMSGRTLAWGGSTFAAVGLIGLIFPAIGNYQIDTGIKIHNLAHLGLGFFLAVIMLFTVAALSFYLSLKEVSRMPLQEMPNPANHGDCGHPHHESAESSTL